MDNYFFRLHQAFPNSLRSMILLTDAQSILPLEIVCEAYSFWYSCFDFATLKNIFHVRVSKDITPVGADTDDEGNIVIASNGSTKSVIRLLWDEKTQSHHVDDVWKGSPLSNPCDIMTFNLNLLMISDFGISRVVFLYLDTKQSALSSQSFSSPGGMCRVPMTENCPLFARSRGQPSFLICERGEGKVWCVDANTRETITALPVEFKWPTGVQIMPSKPHIAVVIEIHGDATVYDMTLETSLKVFKGLGRLVGINKIIPMETFIISDQGSLFVFNLNDCDQGEYHEMKLSIPGSHQGVAYFPNQHVIITTQMGDGIRGLGNRGDSMSSPEDDSETHEDEAEEEEKEEN